MGLMLFTKGLKIANNPKGAILNAAADALIEKDPSLLEEVSKKVFDWLPHRFCKVYTLTFINMRYFPSIKLVLLLSTIFTFSCGKDESPEEIYPYFFDSNCNIEEPSSYDGLSTECLFSIFTDDFNNNDKNWNLANDSGYEQKIEGGFLKLKTEESENFSWGVSNDVPNLSELDGFQIEVEL